MDDDILYTTQFVWTTHREFGCRVAGVTYKNPDEVSRQEILRHCREGDPVALLRDSRNRYSATAVLIQTQYGSIGHVPHDESAEVAAELDSGLHGRGSISRLGTFIPDDRDCEIWYAEIEVEVCSRKTIRVPDHGAMDLRRRAERVAARRELAKSQLRAALRAESQRLWQITTWAFRFSDSGLQKLSGGDDVLHWVFRAVAIAGLSAFVWLVAVR